MAVHLIKLCVGIESVAHLEEIQTRRLEGLKAKNPDAVLRHVTRQMPARRKELLAGGSLYWVIKGMIRIRQPITGIERFLDEDGVYRCALSLDSCRVLVKPRARNAFQGWRYLEMSDVPADLGDRCAAEAELPLHMVDELTQLGLL